MSIELYDDVARLENQVHSLAEQVLMLADMFVRHCELPNEKLKLPGFVMTTWYGSIKFGNYDS